MESIKISINENTCFVRTTSSLSPNKASNFFCKLRNKIFKSTHELFHTIFQKYYLQEHYYKNSKNTVEILSNFVLEDFSSLLLTHKKDIFKCVQKMSLKFFSFIKVHSEASYSPECESQPSHFSSITSLKEENV